jgi:hypothetical protein
MVLVVLDLNGTLVDSTHHRRHTTEPPDARARSKFVYFRPLMREFLQWLFSVADVAVWSSNEPQNVRALVELVFTPEQRSRLVFVWNRTHCDPDASSAYATVKPLAHVYRFLATCAIPRFTSMAGAGALASANQVLLVDDSEAKVCEEDRASHVRVAEFTASDATRYSDSGLSSLRAELVRRLGSALALPPPPPLSLTSASASMAPPPPRFSLPR